MPRPNTGGSRAALEAPNIVAAAHLETITPEQRAALRVAFRACLAEWRCNLEILANAVEAPDTEMAAVYMVDTLAALPADVRALDAAVRRALLASKHPTTDLVAA